MGGGYIFFVVVYFLSPTHHLWHQNVYGVGTEGGRRRTPFPPDAEDAWEILHVFLFFVLTEKFWNQNEECCWCSEMSCGRGGEERKKHHPRHGSKDAHTVEMPNGERQGRYGISCVSRVFFFFALLSR